MHPLLEKLLRQALAYLTVVAAGWLIVKMPLWHPFQLVGYALLFCAVQYLLNGVGAFFLVTLGLAIQGAGSGRPPSTRCSCPSGWSSPWAASWRASSWRVPPWGGRSSTAPSGPAASDAVFGACARPGVDRVLS